MKDKETVEQFKAERDRLNEIVMKYACRSTKRFFSLDSQVYREDAVFPVKIKELLGLVASLVLRHLGRIEEKISFAGRFG